MKKGFSLLCMVLILAVTASAFALTDAEVETAARAYVPAGAALKRIETDEGIYEASFTVEATNEKYYRNGFCDGVQLVGGCLEK